MDLGGGDDSDERLLMRDDGQCWIKKVTMTVTSGVCRWSTIDIGHTRTILSTNLSFRDRFVSVCNYGLLWTESLARALDGFFYLAAKSNSS